MKVKNRSNSKAGGKPGLKIRVGGFKTLQAKILTLVVGMVFLSFLVVGTFLMKFAGNSVADLAMGELIAKSDAASHEINEYFMRYINMAEQLSMNNQLEVLFTQVHPGTKLDQAGGFTPAMQTLEKILDSDDGSILGIWMADIDSSQFAQTGGYLSDSTWNVKERPWYSQVSEAGEVILTEPYEDTTTKLQVVSAIAPVYKSGTQEMMGVAGVDFSLEALGKTIGAYTLGESGFYVLTTGAGHIIYHPVSENINRSVTEVEMSDNIRKAMLDKKEGSLEYTSHGLHSYGYVSAVGDTGWMVATGLPDKEFYKERNEVRTVMQITFVSALVYIFLAVWLLARQIATPIKKLTHTANLIAEGNLEVSAQVGSRDEIGQMADAINRTVLQLGRYASYIREITGTLESMAQGDMRIQLEQDYVGEFAPIKAAFENISTSLNNTLLLIDTAAEQVNVGSNQVSDGAQALAAGATQQAASVEELGASVESIAHLSADNLIFIERASELVKQSGEGADAGNEHMEQLSEAMEDIGSSSRQIENITRVIEDIAFQTNLLALNAAIEAARAGSAGKGFAVVAEEVRNLAAKSAEAAKQTGEHIQRSVTDVSKGAQITAQMVLILKEVGESAREVTEAFVKIQQASKEESGAIEQIKQGLAQVSVIVQTNAAAAQENSATSEEMSAQAATLREEVRKFTLDRERLYTRRTPLLGTYKSQD